MQSADMIVTENPRLSISTAKMLINNTTTLNRRARTFLRSQVKSAYVPVLIDPSVFTFVPQKCIMGDVVAVRTYVREA